MKPHLEGSQIYKMYENGAKRCGYKLRKATNWVDVYAKNVGWVLMNRAKALEFIGQTRRQFLLKETSTTTEQ